MAAATTTAPSVGEEKIIPKLQNIVSTANLGRRLNLKILAHKAINCEYNPSRFAAAIMRIRSPKTTALVFSSGKLVCTGAKSEDDSRTAARKFARIIQKVFQLAEKEEKSCETKGKRKTTRESVKFSEFKIQNIVGNCNVACSIRLEAVALTHSPLATYEPEIFPGLVYRMPKPKITILVFVSGNIVLTGARVRQEIYDAFDNILPILLAFRKR